MKDEQCVRFLQWTLPQLGMRWPGFRKVRRQVCRRVDRRVRDLGLMGIEQYRDYLSEHPDEWRRLDGLCRITISRFCRDKAVFAALLQEILPSLVQAVRKRGDTALHVWSAGCGSGEEPYTLAIMWTLELQARFPDISIDIVATDADSAMIRRARKGRYEFSSLKELPEIWRSRVFSREDGSYCIEPEYVYNVDFRIQDIRVQQPEGRFDLVLCRNLVFTYFDDPLQLMVLSRIVNVMHDGAALVLGLHERLPRDARGLVAWSEKQRIYRKSIDALRP